MAFCTYVLHCGQRRTLRARARVTMVTHARRVTRARAGHPKSVRSPLRVHFSFQANTATLLLRATQKSPCAPPAGDHGHPRAAVDPRARGSPEIRSTTVKGSL
eukprot:7469233-Pyramimonas_sp.AAC.1